MTPTPAAASSLSDQAVAFESPSKQRTVRENSGSPDSANGMDDVLRTIALRAEDLLLRDLNAWPTAVARIRMVPFQLFFADPSIAEISEGDAGVVLQALQLTQNLTLDVDKRTGVLWIGAARPNEWPTNATLVVNIPGSAAMDPDTVAAMLQPTTGQIVMRVWQVTRLLRSHHRGRSDSRNGDASAAAAAADEVVDSSGKRLAPTTGAVAAPIAAHSDDDDDGGGSAAVHSQHRGAAEFARTTEWCVGLPCGAAADAALEDWTAAPGPLLLGCPDGAVVEASVTRKITSARTQSRIDAAAPLLTHYGVPLPPEEAYARSVEHYIASIQRSLARRSALFGRQTRQPRGRTPGPRQGVVGRPADGGPARSTAAAARAQSAAAAAAVDASVRWCEVVDDRVTPRKPPRSASHGPMRSMAGAPRQRGLPRAPAAAEPALRPPHALDWPMPYRTPPFYRTSRAQREEQRALRAASRVVPPQLLPVRVGLPGKSPRATSRVFTSSVSPTRQQQQQQQQQQPQRQMSQAQLHQRPVSMSSPVGSPPSATTTMTSAAAVPPSSAAALAAAEQQLQQPRRPRHRGSRGRRSTRKAEGSADQQPEEEEATSTPPPGLPRQPTEAPHSNGAAAFAGPSPKVVQPIVAPQTVKPLSFAEMLRQGRENAEAGKAAPLDITADGKHSISASSSGNGAAQAPSANNKKADSGAPSTDGNAASAAVKPRAQPSRPGGRAASRATAAAAALQ